MEILYKATDGPNWCNNKDWLSVLPLSGWHGIKVHENSNSNFIVKKIYLQFNHLSGEIPKEIGKLINLQDLYLDHNELSGEIPNEIQQLKCNKAF